MRKLFVAAFFALNLCIWTGCDSKENEVVESPDEDLRAKAREAMKQNLEGAEKM